MAAKKFYDVVGFGIATETTPGNWEEVVTERRYFGDVKRNSRQINSGDKVNSDLSVGNSISIVAADDYANEHFHAIRYIKWAGAYWYVDDIEVQSPRLVLRLGGVYNGPKADSVST